MGGTNPTMLGCNTVAQPNCLNLQVTRIAAICLRTRFQPGCFINPPTRFQPECFRTRIDATCFPPGPSPVCITPLTPWTGPGPVIPRGGGGAFGAAVAPQAALPTANWACPTPATHCFICPPPELANQQFGAAGQTAATVCTQFGQQCQSAVDACPTRLCGGGGFEAVGAAGGQTAATVCTQFGQQCLSAVDACPTRIGCPTYPSGDCTFFNCPPHGQTAATVCTQVGCPTYPSGDCTFFGCPPGGGGGGQTAATVCTQFGHQCQSAVDACPTRLCGGGGGFAAAGGGQTAATVCTQVGCPTYPSGDCTFFGCPPGGGGGQTAATVCTQFGHQCQSAVDACPTRICGGGGGGGGQTAATVCTQFGHQCQSAVDACPTRFCGGGGGVAAGAAGNWPTPMTRCFIC